MKTTLFIESSNGNIYLYDFIKKEFIPCHFIVRLCYLLDQKKELNNLYEITDSNGNAITEIYKKKDIEYYLEKYLHYKRLGYFSSFEKKEFPKYDKSVIIESLSNINNIVFEVTDACNLNCTYCTYGSMYYDYDPRKNQMMSFDTVQTIFNYFIPLWRSKLNKSSEQMTSIGFYGGEPLLNFRLIQESVDYCNHLNLSNRKFKYTMTTNATLIDKYISFLVENDFQIAISLDGTKQNQSYRRFHNGENSYDKVFKNVKLIQKKYPEFFETNISFNSVLHNRNSVEEIHQFIFEEFGKIPQINSVNNYGIKPEKIKEFESIFILYNDSTNRNNSKMISERFTSDPNVFRLGQFLLWYGNNQFFDYESFLYSDSRSLSATTGTCVPFSRKMFITVNKKIMVCERVDFKYAMGFIENNFIHLDLERIAEKYNQYYNVMYKLCKDCYMINGCHQCIFQLKDLDDNPVCHGYKSESQMSSYIKTYIDMLEDNLIPFKRLHKDVNFS
jgi:uncharacterized protein